MSEEFPDWAAFTPESVAADLPQLLDSCTKALEAVEASAPKTFEELVWAMTDATRPLDRCWHRLSHMMSVMNADAWRKVQSDFQPQVVAFSLRLSQSRPIYLSAKSLLDHDATLTPTRRRILAKLVESAEQAGVGLEGSDQARFNALTAEMARLAMDFHNTVLDATNAFSFEKDGKTWTIDDANYPEAMKHCPDRAVRETLCRARAMRAPANEPRIVEMLRLRAEQAKLLGFKTFADLSLSSKCAPSVEVVMKMIDDLDAATASIAAREDEELARFARSVGGPETLAPWDYAFYAERLREKTYAYSEEELKQSFELEDVLRGLFRVTKFLYGVDVEEVSAAQKPSVWHPDVRFFAVKEAGETIAHFYFDPYVRNGLKSGGAWMNEFRNRSVRGAAVTTPLAVICTNFPMPDAEGRCLLPFREVETLFHEFGHALQCMLTRVDEEAAAGINLVEWDAVEVASQFQENWCLDDRTQIDVPAALKAKVRAAKNYRAANACRRQLAFAAVDLALHTEPKDACTPTAIMNALFARFGVPHIPDDRFLCAFTHIFAGGYAAGYYGYKWAEVMSADCFGAFEEAGLTDDEALRRLGARYRETILARGGSQSALDVFRAFRGRDPEIAALLRQQDLIK